MKLQPLLLNEECRPVIDYNYLNAYLRSSLGGNLEAVEVTSVALGGSMDSAFYNFLRKAVEIARENGYYAHTKGLTLDLILKLRLTVNGQQQIGRVTIPVVHQHEFKLLFPSPFTRLDAVKSLDIACRMPYTRDQYIEMWHEAFQVPANIDGVQYGKPASKTSEAEDSLILTVRKLSEGLLSGSRKQTVIKRHKRFVEHRIFENTLPKGVENVPAMTVGVNMPVFRVEMNATSTTKMYIYFSTHFAFIANYSPEGDLIGVKWIYSLHAHSLDQAHEALSKQLRQTPSYTLDTLRTWLRLADLRTAI